MPEKITAFICGKDQGLTLRTALFSVKDADEVLYLDGGSSDNSCVIAEQAGAKVIHVPAGNSGSDFRNIAAATAKSEWLLWISCDDELEAGGIEKLRAAMNPKHQAISLNIQETKFTHRHTFTRMYRPNLKWIGRCHEYLEVPPDTLAPVVVYHHRGPWHDNPTDPDGIIKSLLADIQDMPDNPRWPYFLAREYFVKGRLQEAVEWFKRRIFMPGGYPPETADACFLASRAMHGLDDLDGARQFGAIAVMMNPHFKEAVLFMAELAHPLHKEQWLRMAETATNAGCLCVRI